MKKITVNKYIYYACKIEFHIINNWEVIKSQWRRDIGLLDAVLVLHADLVLHSP